MILRRFMKHVTEQNWFAVGLDVLVVIVGIFLGLQVQAWYEDQQATVEEARVISNLISDMEEITLNLDSLILVARQNEANSKFALNILEQGVLEPEDKARFQQGLADLSKARTINFMDGVINEGSLININDADVRMVITDFMRRILITNYAISQSLKIIDHGRGITTSRTAILDGPDDKLIAYYDFEELKNDREYRAALLNIYGSVSSINKFLGRTQLSTDKLINALRQYQQGQVVERVAFQ